MEHEVVVILDFGSQYTQLIARRVRELGVYCEIHPFTALPAAFAERLPNVRAVILSGGPSSVYDEEAPVCDEEWLSLGIPVLGVCYGMQLLAHRSGGDIGKGTTREYGEAELEIAAKCPLFAGFEPGSTTQVWMSHGDHVDAPPSGFVTVAKSRDLPCAAFMSTSKQIFGIQFHPEVEHTIRGREILRNFVIDIAGCRGDWTPASFIEEAIERIRTTVGSDANVVCGLSGGVDSTVAAVLVHRAIGERLHCIFVNNGLLRAGEAEEVVAALGPNGLGLPLQYVDASERFLTELNGVVDPETKRKIIGRVFIEVFDEESHRLGKVTHLVQGTLYPDVIESVSVKGPSATIKTHHNVGGLPERMRLKLIEPLRELFKDEVRKIGVSLDIPGDLLWRQPFPGPGLAVRVIGELNFERLELLRKTDAILVEEMRQEGIYREMWQGFAVLLPVKSVGVMGDGRTYQYTVALRLVSSSDGMTATWYCPTPAFLRRVSSRITNEVNGINRVVLDISNKPPATIEWE